LFGGHEMRGSPFGNGLTHKTQKAKASQPFVLDTLINSSKRWSFLPKNLDQTSSDNDRFAMSFHSAKKVIWFMEEKLNH
jgi:hypothetical protein